MNPGVTNPVLATRLAQDFAAAAPHLPGAVLSHERRRAAIDALSAQGLPTSRDENWKYLNLRTLDKVRFVPAIGQPQSAVTIADLPAPIRGYDRYTFLDGTYCAALSAPVERAGVLVRPLAASPGSLPGRVEPSLPPDLRFALLNDAFVTDGAAIRIAAGTDCLTCIELVFLATVDSRTGASYPRVDFQIEPGARVGLIERHVSTGADAPFVNSAVNVDIARGATVQHYRVQQTGPRAIWFDTLTATLAQDARYQLHSVNLGALSARSTVNVRLLGERAEVGLFNVSVGGRNQIHDTFALVEHLAPHTRTEQGFRGIASGRARVAFNGKIVVRRDARGTDSRQSLRGLLAGADAEIDVRPQLEIHTDDVRCSHGATAGKLDDNMLFYLLSRGLDRETALRLLKWAFLEDVVAKIDVPELRRQIEQSLAGQLNETAALKELL